MYDYYKCFCNKKFDLDGMKTHFKKCNHFQIEFNDIEKSLSTSIKKFVDKINLSDQEMLINGLALLKFFLKRYVNLISQKINNNIKAKPTIEKNEEEKGIKTFYHGAKNAKLIQLRDKDMEKVRIMKENVLRNNITQNREQYLKILLVKQIKSAQIVKAKMNNKSNLKVALLKWRAALAPVNYLVKIKRIKKGCKIFKLCFKKRNERHFFDGIYNLAKKNIKKFLLEDFDFIKNGGKNNIKINNNSNNNLFHEENQMFQLTVNKNREEIHNKEDDKDETFNSIKSYLKKMFENNSCFSQDLVKVMSGIINVKTSKKCFLGVSKQNFIQSLVKYYDENYIVYCFELKGIYFLVILSD